MTSPDNLTAAANLMRYTLNAAISQNHSFLSDDAIEKAVNGQFTTMHSNFSLPVQVAFIVAFSVLIVFGTMGNGLVCYAVVRNPHMRTPRNIFIINLAISDLTLCLFTQPFNLLKVSMPVWRLGDAMCKLVPMFSGTNVFVSTISITAIALDRFQVIVYPTRDSMRNYGTCVALVSIWITALLMAGPMLIFNTTQSFEPLPNVFIRLCVEDPRLTFEKGAYSVASVIFQYIVPVVIVSVAHARICNKLKYRMVNQRPPSSAATSTNAAHGEGQKRKTRRQAKRKRRTNLLLVGIALVFAFSWMPLNVFNVMADFGVGHMHRLEMDANETFALCHLLVLASACTNPVLYGWLNENFRREFKQVLGLSGADSGAGVVGGGRLASNARAASKFPRVGGARNAKDLTGHTPLDDETSRLHTCHLAVDNPLGVESTYDLTSTDIHLHDSIELRSTVSL